MTTTLNKNIDSFDPDIQRSKGARAEALRTRCENAVHLTAAVLSQVLELAQSETDSKELSASEAGLDIRKGKLSRNDVAEFLALVGSMDLEKWTPEVNTNPYYGPIYLGHKEKDGTRYLLTVDGEKEISESATVTSLRLGNFQRTGQTITIEVENPNMSKRKYPLTNSVDRPNISLRIDAKSYSTGIGFSALEWIFRKTDADNDELLIMKNIRQYDPAVETLDPHRSSLN